MLVELLALHLIDGRTIQINPAQVTQLIHPRDEGRNKQINERVKCVVKFTDGSFASVAEPCDDVQALMEGRRK